MSPPTPPPLPPAPPPFLVHLFLCFTVPVLFMLISLSYLPKALVQSLLALDFSLSSLRHRWFALFWGYLGPQSAERSAPHVGPLLARGAHGVVVDIGTGAGHQLRHYDPSRITRLLAVEPNPGFHAAIRQRAAEAGLADKLEVVGVPVAEMMRMAASSSSSSSGYKSSGKVNGGGGGDVVVVGEGEADTVVTLQVLCSVPQPAAVARDLYRLLKPGGEWLLFEHVSAGAGGQQWLVTNLYQWLVSLPWPYIIGCDLRCDTETTVRRAGLWKSDSLTRPDPAFATIPHILGSLVKV